MRASPVRFQILVVGCPLASDLDTTATARTTDKRAVVVDAAGHQHLFFNLFHATEPRRLGHELREVRHRQPERLRAECGIHFLLSLLLNGELPPVELGSLLHDRRDSHHRLRHLAAPRRLMHVGFALHTDVAVRSEHVALFEQHEPQLLQIVERLEPEFGGRPRAAGAFGVGALEKLVKRTDVRFRFRVGRKAALCE